MDKETIINIVYIVPLLIGVIIYYARQHLKERRTKKSVEPKINQDGASFIDQLERLSYFQFTSDESLDLLKSEMHKYYENHGILVTEEKNDHPVCNRIFSADEEYLFEEGGIIETLTGLKPAFEIRKLPFDINDSFENYKGNIANQWVVINDRKYVIYENLDGSQVSWNYSTRKVISLLNEELKRLGSLERFYTISGGNDCQIILLSPDQYKFIDSSNLINESKPQELKITKEEM